MKNIRKILNKILFFIPVVLLALIFNPMNVKADNLTTTARYKYDVEWKS